jgi:hypothetical protein
MRTNYIIRTLVICIFFVALSSKSFSQAANNTCSTAQALTPGSSCTPYTGNLQKATSASTDGSISGACGSATTATTYDVWFKFTATSTFPVITVNNLGNNLTATSTYIELLSGTCASLTSLNCQNVSTRLTPSSALTVGSTYYVRVYTTSQGTSNPASKYDFDICIQTAPANDDCSGAITLTSSASCSNTTSTLDLATVTSGLPAGCESAGAHYDTWYKFAATGTTQTVTISSLGANITNPEIQLYSGTCGALTSLACGTTSLVGSGLTIGNTYYIRVSNVGSNPSGTTGAGFSICVFAPVPAKVDYSKSYINVTKGSTGGTVDPGDTLEMRFTLVVSSKTIDSLAIYDTLFNTRGLALVPGSLALRTNEGKVYKSYTDGFDSDAGWFYKNGLDTIIRINFGTNATNFARGQLSNTSRPSVFNSTCIVMATYRVVVYAGYNTLINFKTGGLTYRDQATTILSKQTFSTDNLIVYRSPGLCPNAVSATNALGAESNGTFGTPSGSGALARNRGTTSFIGTGYAYMPFTTSGGPNDYYYGIANNTSSKFTTVNTWTKPDANGYRVFQQWDITGDHTGSTTSQGNVACDTTKPVSPTNPCGYMLVVNSAYRADTAFTYTVNNLCPNTYYEISAWFKNICYKCGCDSTGASATTAGYIPTAPGDSSGVNPNIAFDVNGVDYYTTGNLKYLGLTTPTGSDSSNQWHKRGFVYLTGPTETSFTLTLRNNAPGGGGNDWALDDISVATCLPNMQYSPSLNPTACMNNPITINDTIRSYFNNYNYYKWQRSTDGGATWTDIAGTSGTATPAWNGSSWEYITSYTVPTSYTDTTNTGNKYRVVVATTSGNITNANCQVTDGVSIINLNVVDCNNPLDTRLISFNGKMITNRAHLNWSTTRESERMIYEVERSTDGRNFDHIGAVQGYYNNAESNQYTFVDSSFLTGKTFYRIALVTVDGRKRYSHTIQLNSKAEDFSVMNVINPFESAIMFDVVTSSDSKIDAFLLNSSGSLVKQQSFTVQNGINNLSLKNLDYLPSGVYILQLRNKENIITQKIVKK